LGKAFFKRLIYKMDSDNEDNDDKGDRMQSDDALHDSINHLVYINITPKFAVYDVILYIPDQLKPLHRHRGLFLSPFEKRELSLLNPLYIDPINQKNKIS